MASRLGIGGGTIAGQRRKNFSSRAVKGSLFVTRRFCPSCGHGKALDYASVRRVGPGLKCSRCGFVFDKRRGAK